MEQVEVQEQVEVLGVILACDAATGATQVLQDLASPCGIDVGSELGHWIGTSQKPARCDTDLNGVPETSGIARNCAVCGHTCVVTYWCKICENVPYCSKVCSDINWEKYGHWKTCARSDGKYVGLCAVCGKRSVVGCHYCKFTFYCGSECHRRHWYEGGHKEACPKRPMSFPQYLTPASG